MFFYKLYIFFVFDRVYNIVLFQLALHQNKFISVSADADGRRLAQHVRDLIIRAAI